MNENAQNDDIQGSSIRIGTDLVACARLEKSLESQSFLTKVFHPTEIEDCLKKAKPTQSFAGRFAAKEAFLKALGTGLYTRGMGPLDVWIVSGSNGRPQLKLSESAQALLASHGECIGRDVSITHDADIAIASVVLQFRTR